MFSNVLRALFPNTNGPGIIDVQKISIYRDYVYCCIEMRREFEVSYLNCNNCMIQ